MGTGTHMSMSALDYLYVRAYMCLYTHAGKYIFRYSLLAHKTVGLATERWTHTALSVFQVCFSKLVPLSQIHLCFLRLFFKPTNLSEFLHFDTMKQINTEYLSSSGRNLLSFAKLEIFDLLCQGEKIKGKQACFLKAEEIALKKIKKKKVSKSSQMMIHGHISQYLVKNMYL